MKIKSANSDHEILFDDEDELIVSKIISWRVLNNHSSRGYEGNLYAIGWDGKKLVLGHRLVLGLSKGDGKQVDHINRNGLDNRRSNLRIVSQTENNLNSKHKSALGLTGVRINKTAKKSLRFYSTLKVNKKGVYLGSFDTPEEAFNAYKEARRKYYGERFATISV